MRGKEGSTIVTIAIAVFLGLALLVPICHSASEGEETSGMPTGWTDDIRITNFSNNDVKVAINADEANVYLVWERTVVVSSDYEVYFVKSNDSGESWNNPQQISNSGIYATNPDINAKNSKVDVVWGDWKATTWEIFYRNSTDGGETWNSEKRISIDDGKRSQGPRITVSNSNIHVVWVDDRFFVSPDWNTEIYYVRSTDGGITWDDGLGNIGQERRLTNTIYSSAPSGIVTNNSNIHMLFGDDRESMGSFNVYYKRSVDNGATWDDGLGNIDQDRKLTTNGTNHGPGAIAVNGSTIHVIWVDFIDPNYYLYYRNSTDNGATWNTIQLLTGPTQMIASPDVSVRGSEVHVVWDDSRDGAKFFPEIYYKNSTDGGITWSSDIRLTYNLSEASLWPRIALSNDTRHVVWWDGRDGNDEIYYKRYPDFPVPEYNISLQEGWNLISLPLEQTNESITEVLSSINGKWDYVQAYDPLAPESWRTYATFKPSQLNELHSLNHKMGFWINITEPNVTLTVQGPIPSSTSIPLYAGWNLVGYPSLTNETVGNALWGTGADKVEVFDPGEPYRIREVGPSYVMKPGEGYWIHVVTDSVWTIDW